MNAGMLKLEIYRVYLYSKQKIWSKQVDGHHTVLDAISRHAFIIAAIGIGVTLKNTGSWFSKCINCLHSKGMVCQVNPSFSTSTAIGLSIVAASLMRLLQAR